MEEVTVEHSPAQANGSVQAWLREETADAHRAAERAVMQALIPFATSRYAAYLQSVLALYEALEPRLWGACGALVPDAAARIKAPWLHEDLAALGAPHLPMCAIDLPSLGHPLEALGAAYVIEGSTLGGPVLLARLRAAGILMRGAAGARFLSGYGASTATMWRAFRASLEGAGRDPRGWPLLRRGALAMFEAYQSAIAREGTR